MTESINIRVKFKKGEQKKYINKILETKKYSTSVLGKKIGVSRRTIADWRREKNLISKSGLATISRLSKIYPPKNIKYLNKYWYTSKGGKAGYSAVIKKYGIMQVDERKRSLNWKKWWNVKGKNIIWNYSQPKPFKKPKKSKELAEFIGAMMGDGTMSKYQISIALHYKDDKKYGDYITKQMIRLFNVIPTISRVKNVHTYTISRVDLVKYLFDLGLVIGNKVEQNFDIPKWIKENSKYAKECIRGLFDTDGCLVRHNYISNGKIYKYKKVDITSKSNNLLNSIHDILNQLGIKNRISRQYSIRVEALGSVKKFFDLIGSNNPKHKKKYFVV